MEAVWYRVLDIQDAASRRRGGPKSLSAIDLRSASEAWAWATGAAEPALT